MCGVLTGVGHQCSRNQTDQASDGAVEEEIVPRDGGADGGSDDGAAELYLSSEGVSPTAAKSVEGMGDFSQKTALRRVIMKLL